MLNTVPLPIPHPLPASHLFPRRRDGQPSNCNALKHGLYSAKNTTPLTPFTGPLTLDQLGLGTSPAAYDQVILGLREQLLQTLLAAPKSAGFHKLLAWHQPIFKSLKSIERLELVSYRQKYSALHLKIAAAYPLQLIRWDFHYQGITRDADLPGCSRYSFREKCGKSDLHSTISTATFFPSPNANFHLGRPVLSGATVGSEVVGARGGVKW